MNAYVCVYRRSCPSAKDFERTRLAGVKDPFVKRFLDIYYNDTSYFDWGDDPSFFAAHYRLGDVRLASWGVCRPDVRAVLNPGDFVVFFCGRAEPGTEGCWKYFFVGVGSVSRALSRTEVWQQSRFTPYRQFYNILAKATTSGWAQQETFHPYHAKWRARAQSPYILFEPSTSAFNLDSPLHVATYAGTVPETWDLQSPRVRELHDMLFIERGITRPLRTARYGHAHPKLNLGRYLNADRPGRPLPDLRTALLHLVRIAD